MSTLETRDKFSREVIAICILAILITGGCVQFKKLNFYDGMEQPIPPVKPMKISYLMEPVIFYDDLTDVWGVEDEACKQASISKDVVYSGTTSIKISWNRYEEDCTFAGFGIGWDGYAGKDLSGLIDFAAIRLHVRSEQGRMFGLPIVLTLVDYSGGMGFCYTTNKYFDRAIIDEEWQKVVVPLRDFDLETENLDISNIKQLQLELQQSGSIYIDDISLVLYEPVLQEPWMEEDSLQNPTNFPIILFDEDFNYEQYWGLISDRCQTISLSKETAFVGKRSIYVSWNTDKVECNWVAFGVSWNKWFPIDLSPVLSAGAIQFDVMLSSDNMDGVPVKVGFEDYERAKGLVLLNAKYTESGLFTKGWQKVTIPFSELPKNIQISNIKQLYIEFIESGEVYLDQIQLIQL